MISLANLKQNFILLDFILMISQALMQQLAVAYLTPVCIGRKGNEISTTTKVHFSKVQTSDR